MTPPTTEAERSSRDAVDIDLHGVVRVRLVDAPEETAASIARGLGSPPRPPGEAPADVTVRFVDRFRPARLTYLGLDDAAFDDDDFYLRDRATGELTTSVPFDGIGGACEIVSVRSGSVPLLSQIVRLAYLAKGWIPIHASGFVYNGFGIVVTGWAKSGKTEALLAFTHRGARYVGDEWLLLSNDGHSVVALPNAVTLREWHLREIGSGAPRLRFQERLLFRSVAALARIHASIRSSRFRDAFFVGALDKAVPELREAMKIRRPPDAVAPSAPRRDQAPVDHLLLLLSDNEPRTVVQRSSSQELVERVSASFAYELAWFRKKYLQFLFAFPERRSELLDNLDERYRALLTTALAGRDVHTVRHPYPFSFQELFDRVSAELALDTEIQRRLRPAGAPAGDSSSS